MLQSGPESEAGGALAEQAFAAGRTFVDGMCHERLPPLEVVADVGTVANREVDVAQAEGALPADGRAVAGTRAEQGRGQR